MPDWTTQKVIEEFGPVTRITRAREDELIQEGKSAHVLTLVGADVGYFDLPVDDRPSEEVLADRGESRHEYSRTVFHAFVGRRIVDVEEIYETAKPMPADLEIQDDDIDFGEDGFSVS